MEDLKIKLSLEDFKELIQNTEDMKEDKKLLNINEIVLQNRIVDEDTIDWSPWFKAIYGR
ncbi:hypothetical protein AY601_3534 [Pedobacter cryoconitis]|uniref:Uncharacterized protein n=1 Tax=Pedobacter cryoconitis TaxID=188932 RepID=A0A127VHL1_9SPHI|nr:hypothetical protein [Pedobacter cryoconitis]AMQ00399.1 hypothetical protein AY601_3534 [Pedobacter cryoconitis]